MNIKEKVHNKTMNNILQYLKQKKSIEIFITMHIC